MGRTKRRAGAVKDRVKELRLEAGLTQGELAAAAGMSKDAINRIETGDRDPSLQSLYALGKALGVHPAEFLGWGHTDSPLSPRVMRLANLLQGHKDEVVKAVETCAKAIIEIG